MHAPILYNRWFGKALGATLGWALTPVAADGIWLSLATLIGFGIGHWFDQWAPARGTASAGFNQQAATQEFMFACLGHIARAGGSVRSAHIDFAESLIARLAFGERRRQAAIAAFHAGRDDKISLAAQARTYLANTNSEQRRAALKQLCALPRSTLPTPV